MSSTSLVATAAAAFLSGSGTETTGVTLDPFTADPADLVAFAEEHDVPVAALIGTDEVEETPFERQFREIVLSATSEGSGLEDCYFDGVHGPKYVDDRETAAEAALDLHALELARA